VFGRNRPLIDFKGISCGAPSPVNGTAVHAARRGRRKKRESFRYIDRL
jgi:hypothetical protein